MAAKCRRFRFRQPRRPAPWQAGPSRQGPPRRPACPRPLEVHWPPGQLHRHQALLLNGELGEALAEQQHQRRVLVSPCRWLIWVANASEGTDFRRRPRWLVGWLVGEGGLEPP